MNGLAKWMVVQQQVAALFSNGVVQAAVLHSSGNVLCQLWSCPGHNCYAETI